MILLLDMKHAHILQNPEALRRWATEAQIPDGTPIILSNDLPDTDDDGLPIFAFSISAGETHYWRGEPIKIPVK